MVEQRLLQSDTLLRFDPATGCRTAVEGSAMQKLKAEIQQALEKVEKK